MTNPLTKLEQLEQSATPGPLRVINIPGTFGWEIRDSTNDLICYGHHPVDNIDPTPYRIVALFTLAPHLIALWKAAKKCLEPVTEPHVVAADVMPIRIKELKAALDALERKEG